MLEDQSASADHANQSEDAHEERGSSTTPNPRNPNDESPGHKQHNTNDEPNPILPVRTWFWIVTAWNNRRRANIAEAITGFLTLAIVIVGILQWRVYTQQKGIMESSGKQTTQLIDAANIQACAASRNADAAESFSTSAGIQATAFSNAAKAMTDQVQKLQAGVEQTSKLVTAADTANMNFREALEAQTRPWVGPDGEPRDAHSGTIIPGTEPAQFAIDFTIELNNFGHSPAQRVTVEHVRSPMLRASENMVACQNADKRIRTDTGHPLLLTIFQGSPKSYKIEGSHPGEDEAVCIAYLGTSDMKTIHHTVLLYRALRVPPEPGFPNGKPEFRIFLDDSEAN